MYSSCFNVSPSPFADPPPRVPPPQSLGATVCSRGPVRWILIPWEIAPQKLQEVGVSWEKSAFCPECCFGLFVSRRLSVWGLYCRWWCRNGRWRLPVAHFDGPLNSCFFLPTGFVVSSQPARHYTNLLVNVNLLSFKSLEILNLSQKRYNGEILGWDVVTIEDNRLMHLACGGSLSLWRLLTRIPRVVSHYSDTFFIALKWHLFVHHYQSDTWRRWLCAPGWLFLFPFYRVSQKKVHNRIFWG